MELKQYDRVGRLIREILSNERSIERWRKENEEYLDELGKLLGRPVTLEEVLEIRETED